MAAPTKALRARLARWPQPGQQGRAPPLARRQGPLPVQVLRPRVRVRVHEQPPAPEPRSHAPWVRPRGPEPVRPRRAEPATDPGRFLADSPCHRTTVATDRGDPARPDAQAASVPGLAGH